MDNNYHLGLLCFVHLLIKADGVTDQTELEALENIKAGEKIPLEVITEFEALIGTKTEQEIYIDGLNYIRQCSDTEKLRVFAMLYRLSEIDGRVHTQEINLLLNSARTAGVPFSQVVDFARSNFMF